MTSQTIKQDKTVAAFIHLSTFSQFFFPFGNFIFPLIFWTAKKNDPFVNEHGKQALNFQISFFLYALFIVLLGVAGAILIGINLNMDNFYFNDHGSFSGSPLEATPVIIYIMVMALLLLSLLVLNLYAVVSATVRAGEGKLYQYPLSINFLNATGDLTASEANSNNASHQS